MRRHPFALGLVIGLAAPMALHYFTGKLPTKKS